MQSLSGDIHNRCLGAFLQRKLNENGMQHSLSYEEKLGDTRCRADILIDNRIDIEVKAQGVFSIHDTTIRWQRLVREVLGKEHVLVSFRHNRSTIGKIRSVIPESHHFYFEILNTEERQPRELERLILSILEWLR